MERHDLNQEISTELARGVSVGSFGRTNTLPLLSDQPLWDVARQSPPFFCAFERENRRRPIE